MTDTFTADEVSEVLDTDKPTTTKPVDDNVQRALMRGDARGLTNAERAEMIKRLTEGYGLNTMTAPVIFIQTPQGLMVPYLTARGAAELRKRHGLEVVVIEVVKERPGLVVLRCTLRDPQGRTDIGLGAASWREDRPGDEENAWLRAETKSKRRATMSMVGVFLEGPSDEIEGE